LEKLLGRGDSPAGAETGLARIMTSVNIKLMMEEEEVTQQMVQHLILVLNCPEELPLI